MKRILAFLLALCLMFGQVPATVFALEPGTAPDEIAELHEEPEVTAPPVEEESDTVAAKSGQCGDNVYWNLSDDGVLTISGTGPMWDYLGTADLSPFAYLNSTFDVIIEYGVSSIGNYAFYLSHHLRSITIPNSIEGIGAAAFWGCDDLNSVSIPNSVNIIGHCAFLGCESLQSITIPNSVVTIGNQAFKECHSLSSVTFGNGLTTIEDEAFINCDKLSSVTFGNSLTTIGDQVFYDCDMLTSVTIPDSVITIGNSVFAGCDMLTSVTISDSVTIMGDYVFTNCGSLTNVTIGNSVTEIGNRAFYFCNHLQSVRIPDSVTEVGEEAFCYCYELSSVTFGSGIKYIRSWAFEDCYDLSTIIFRGNAPIIDDSAFSRVKATAYYPANNSTWTAYKLQNYGGTITWVPYNTNIEIGQPSIQEKTSESTIFLKAVHKVGSGSAVILGSKDFLSIVSDVKIKSVRGEETIPDDGFTISLDDASAQDIFLSKSGYQDYILPTAVTAALINPKTVKTPCYNLTVYMEKDRKDGKPYISTIFGRETGSGNPYVDLRVNELTASKGKKQDIIVTAVGLEGKNATYYLAQDEARRVESKNGIFSAQDLFSVFEDDVTVYAYAKTADGTVTEPQEINIKRDDPDAVLQNFVTQPDFSLFGTDFLSFTVPNSIPLLGGMEFSLDAIEIPLGFDIQGDVVKISIGMNVFERKSDGDGVKTNDIFHDFKDMVYSTSSKAQSGIDAKRSHEYTEKGMQQFAIRNGIGMPNWWALTKKSNSFNVNVLGYVEGKIVDSKIVVKECALSIGGTLTFKYTAQGAVWIVPVYGGFEAGGSITATSKNFRIIPASDVPFEHDIILDIVPKVTGRAGVGVKGAVSAGLYATGSLPIKVEFKRNHFTLSLRGELGAEAELFIFKGKKKILEGTTMLLDKYWGNKRTSVNAVTILDDGCPDDTATVTTVVSRDYADNTSDWLGDWYFAPTVDGDGSAVAAKGVSFRDLQTSIFANSQPQLVTVDDQMLLVWVEDDLNRDTYNRMRLVYSVYDPVMETWSEPRPVWDDGHNDGYPILASDGENAYVLWQKVNTTLTEENTTDIDTALENSELCLAKFEDGAFVDTQMLTSDSLYEYAHTVSIINGEPVVFWASSTENAMNVSGNNALYRWEDGTTEELARNLNYILSIDAVDGEVTYVMDADGELDTTADVTAFTISDVGTTSFDNSEMGAAITWAGYAPLDGENVLFLSDMGNIYYEQDGELKSVLSEVRTMGGNLNIVETDLGTAILWTEQVEGWNELFAATYEDGIWSEAIQISEDGELLTKVVATCYDGKLTGICNTNSVTYDEATETYIKGETDLALFTVNDFSDIELGSYLTINEEDLEIGEETELYVTVYNNGTLPVDEVTFTITDTLGTESEQTVYIDIPSGGSEIVTLTYPVPEGYTSTILTVTAAIDDADANEEDNAVSLEIGNHDLSVTETAVEMLEGGYLLKAVIENGSLVDAENVTLSVSVDDEESAVLQTVTVGTIMRENYALAEILLAEDALTYDENGAAKVYLKLNADGTESADADNSICIIVTEATETVCMHPVTETVEKLDATCTEPGHEAYEACAACGAVVGGIVEIPAGHHYENGICTGCGEADPDYVPEEITGTCGDNLTWTIADGVLTISGEGEMWNFGGEISIPWLTYRDQFTSVVIEEGVTTVGDYAFGFHPITSVSLPETVTHIGTAAFSYTMNMTEVDLPDSLVAIGNEAFAISALTEVIIPASVETIGAKAFICPNLTAFRVDEANSYYYSQDGLLCRENQVIQVPAGYSGELELHTYSWVLGDYAMLYCGNVTKVILPANLDELGTSVFAGCSSLTEIQFLGDAPATIAENTFADLTVTVSYPDANTTWTDEAKQSFGETVYWTTHGENLVARGYCGENQMGSESGTLYFQNAAAGKNATWKLTSDGTMTISGTGRMVNSSPFAGTNPWARLLMNDSSQLTKIVIEEGITTVGEMAFLILGTYVTEVVLPSTVNTICYGAFGNLTALEQVEIPAGVNEIGVYAFFGCTALSEIKFLGDAPVMAEDAFASVVATAYYPANNSTWTADVMQSYGGTITWEAYTPVYSGVCGDNVTWILEGGVLTVSGEGDMWDFGEENTVPWYDYIGDVTSLVIEEGVTGIGDYAFCFLPISSVIVPETVTYIGDGAFGFTMGMGSAVLPESLTAIGDMAFFMSALCEITIPSGVTSIGLNVFGNCPLMTAIHVDEGNSTYYSWNGMLYKEFTLLQVPGGCSGELELHPFTYIIGEGAFMNCERITKLVIPSNTYEIGKDALSSCSGLTEILFHGSVPTTIGENAFNGVTAVISHPNANTTWTEEAKQLFDEAVTWTTYGEDLVAWGICGENAIYDENGQFINHYSAHIPADNVTWKLTADGTMTVSGEGAMMNCVIFGGFTPWYTVFELPTRIVIEEGITYAGEFSFMVFSEVTELVLPTTLQRVGAYAFNYMEKLEKVTIPEGTTVIPDILLAYNAALTSLDIPASVISIGSGAVGGCTALTELRFHGDAPAIAENAFADVVATAYYPAGNPTWTADVMQNYGGTVTWKPVVDAKIVTSGWSGATTWKLYDNGTLLVFGNGNMKNYDYGGGQPWLNQGVDITHVIVAEGVTGIGSGAFRNLTTLKSVTFPATTLTKMGEAAFYGSGLESVEIPASLWTIQPYVFKNCVNLTSVIFHEGNLEKISDGAFYGTGLTELVLPDCLDILDVYAFKGCANLTAITIGNGLTELREAVFYGTAIPTIEIPEGITKIGPYAFKNCVKLETIELPESLTSVGEASFYDCAALKAIDLPDAVVSVGNYAFRRCIGLTSATFGENLVTVGECAFYGCTGLTELVIPDKVTTIKPYAFKTCNGLTSVTLGNSVETIGEGAFNTCTVIKTIVFPASLKTIGDYCFSGSEHLWKLTFEGDAPTIGTGAFKGLDAYGYYPSGNTTWTAENMLNYGGKIEWIAK